MSFCRLVVFALVLGALDASAQQLPPRGRMAVLEFSGSRFSDEELAYVTDLVRATALKHAAGHDIMTRE